MKEKFLYNSIPNEYFSARKSDHRPKKSFILMCIFTYIHVYCMMGCLVVTVLRHGSKSVLNPKDLRRGGYQYGSFGVELQAPRLILTQPRF